MTTKNLTDFSATYFKPTPGQQKAIEALDAFFAGETKVFILKGYAGTGKTTLTKLLAAYVNSISHTAVLMAPTGRAARIMFEKTGFKATTIHKAIYNMEKLDELKIKIKEDKVQYKFRYQLKATEENITNVYLVDEASMISDKYSEDDFFIFGSGIILQDLLEHIAPGNLARKDKLIFIGDDAQLPPVTDRFSGALDAGYLLKKYKIKALEYQLTEVIRQSQESGILENATRLRELIKLPGRQKLHLDSSFPDIKETKQAQMLEDFIEINPALNTKEGILLIAKNGTALDHNLSIREHFFPGKASVQAGETFLINQNNYNYEVELLNGMLVKVLAADETAETKSHMMSYNAQGDACFVSHRFRWVTIEVPVENEQTIAVRCMVLDSFLMSPKRSLDYAENIALYLDFKLRHPDLLPKTPEFTKALRSDPYFNALKVKFGYAITVHKAQGGEWEKVMVNMEHYQSYTSKLFLRWAYTAITRASKHLIVFNLPAYSIFTKLDYKDQRLATDDGHSTPPMKQANRIILQLPEHYPAHLKDWFANEPDFLIEKYHTLLAQLQESGITITGRKKLNYAENYTFMQDERYAYCTFFYNGKNQFSSTLATNGKVNDPALLKDVLALSCKPVDFLITPESNSDIEVKADDTNNEAEETDIIFPEKYQMLKPLFTGLIDAVTEKQINISTIEHKEYLERYFFTRDTQKAMIQFWYDGENRFTTAMPHLPSCNSNELLKDIAETVRDMQEAMNG